MTTDDHRALLIEAYDGERFGVVLGRELARLTADAPLSELYSAFERVERVARDAVAGLVERYGVEASSDAQTDAQGVALAAEMHAKPVADAWRDLLPEIERFLTIFERLGELGDAADQGAVEILIEHERASIEMTREVIAGDLAVARRALDTFLAAHAGSSRF